VNEQVIESDDPTLNKSRDQRARRRLRRLGLILVKARPSGQWINYEPYCIVDPNTNFIIGHESMRIEHIEAWLDEAESA
jgi:hypothetical protein